MRFEEYVNHERFLHPFPTVPKKINDFKHLILYGPEGAGKYTLALRILASYSKTNLKYEKKVTVATSIQPFLVKLSDVHYEIDMEQLGCNGRTIFNEVFGQIQEMLNSRFNEKNGILLCTNLLDIFYSYMQQGVRFILLTESVSFLPDTVTDRCRVMPVPKPSPVNVFATFGHFEPSWRNLKEVEWRVKPPDLEEAVAADIAKNTGKLKVGKLREDLYAVLVHNLSPDKMFWRLAKKLLPMVPPGKMAALRRDLVYCMQCHSCNYRVIFHLELFVLSFLVAIA
jgi:hypothetical protein